MIYNITLRIAYDYAAPSGSSRHLIRLFPMTLPGVQTVRSRRVLISPEPEEVNVFEDFFGNETHNILNKAMHTSLDLRVNAEIERLAPADTAGAVRPNAMGVALKAERDIGGASPLHFLGTSPRVRPASAYAAYGRTAAGMAETVKDQVCAIGEAINRDFAFNPMATQVDTPHEDAFRRREGVCQDFSHVMIACLRALGIPAGYVSGLLRTLPPEGQERLEGSDAMHAWVRAWLGPEAGWFEYDPTNAVAVGQDHITVAVGRDYSDVSPVKGVLRTGGVAGSVQQVDVVEMA